MNILGISGGYYHDSAACILQDGKLIYYVEEERLSGIKHSLNHLPNLCIKRCLEYSNLTMKEIDIIALSWNPFYPENRNNVNRKNENISKIFPEKDFGKFNSRIIIVDHHLSHASSAYRTSNFENALIFTFDGSGDGKSTSVHIGQKGVISELENWDITQSLGWFYQRATTFLGIGNWYDGGKTMAAAAYGKKAFDFPFINVDSDGYHFNYPKHILPKRKMSIEDSNWENDFYGKQKKYLYNFFTSFVSNDYTFPKISEDLITRNKLYPELSDIQKNIACSIQSILEDCILSVVRKFHNRYPSYPICIAGGVAMNCKAIGSILKSISTIPDIYIPPFSTDVGGAIGAALETQFRFLKITKFKLTHAYWGCGFENEQISKWLDSINVKYSKLNNPEDYAAELILKNKIIGWYQGRMEIGARALGNRSILALPNSIELKNRINTQIKNREKWRPFSPSIIKTETTKNYWNNTQFASQYMTMTLNVQNVDDSIAGVVHVDGTSRLQIVLEDTNKSYYKLIRYIGEVSGNPVILNTSLNLRGMPIARLPLDAIRIFYSSPLDAIFLGNNLLQK